LPQPRGRRSQAEWLAAKFIRADQDGVHVWTGSGFKVPGSGFWF
jgi:hypothetical protein